MAELTKEQIETLREALHLSWPQARCSSDALCDLALRGIEDRLDAEKYRKLWNAATRVLTTDQLILCLDRAMAEGREGK